VKILALVSALDLRHRLSSTPAWHQLLKALALEGVDVIAIPYRGHSIESLYWRVYDNPCRVEGEAFAGVREAARLLKRNARAHVEENENTPGSEAPGSNHESVSDKVVRTLAQGHVIRKWSRTLAKVFKSEGTIDAVLVLNLPLNHIHGLATEIRETYGTKVWYYDGDLPASLPGGGGFNTGFRIYEGSDPGEYDGFLSNSKGSNEALRALGARRVETVYWAADLELYRPLDREPEHDVFFYGYGEQYREEWMERMLYGPSEVMRDSRFSLGGLNFGRSRPEINYIGDIPFNGFNEFVCRSRINLVITRAAHRSVYASSSMRPFELGAMQTAMVSNPWPGIEEWFEPGEEILIANSTEEAIVIYEELLRDEPARREMAKRARRRVEAHHTWAHRARQILGILRE